MSFLGDYHTHTVHSHGKGTIEQNVVRAIELGLQELAITDHGFKHCSYNVRRSEWHHIRAEFDEIVSKYPQIKLYLGLETNLQSLDGTVDIDDDDLKLLDIVVMGYHKFIKPNVPADVFSFFWPNFFADMFKHTSPRRKIKNTAAFVKAIERYPIDIISHPQYAIDIDLLEVANAAAHYGTYLELNGKRIKSSDKELEAVISQTNVEFVANSDAHSVDRIGEISLPLEVIDRVKIPLERIANWERLPVLRSRQSKQGVALCE